MRNTCSGWFASLHPGLMLAALAPPPDALSSEPPPLEIGAEARHAVRLSRADCLQLLRKHHPRENVPFTAGHDVRGEPVPKADLEDWSRWSGDVEEGFTFLLYVDPLLFQKGRFPEAVTSSDIPIGIVHYDAATGVLTLNGETVDRESEVFLTRQCDHALRQNR